MASREARDLSPALVFCRRSRAVGTASADRTEVAERPGHDFETLMTTDAHVIRQDDARVRTIVDATLGGDAEDWSRTETG